MSEQYKVGAKVVFGVYTKGTPKDDMIFSKGEELTLLENDASGTPENPAFLAHRNADKQQGYVFASELSGMSEAPAAEVKARGAVKGGKAVKPAVKQEPEEEAAPAVKAPVKGGKVKAKAVKQEAPAAEVKSKVKAKPVEAAPEPVKAKVAVRLSNELRELLSGGADAVLTNAKSVADRLQTDFFYLGAILLEISEKEYFTKVKGEDGEFLQGQPGFEAYIRQELGIEYRMAAHYMSIYQTLTAAGISEAKIKGLKWTKIAQLLKLIASGHITRDNWDEWAVKAKQLKGDAYKEAVQEAMVDAGVTTGPSRGATAKQKRYTFVLFDDRATLLDKALTIAKTRIGEERGKDEEPVSNSEALDLIVSDWLGTITSEG